MKGQRGEGIGGIEVPIGGWIKERKRRATRVDSANKEPEINK
jgi:hypothetical protein